MGCSAGSGPAGAVTASADVHAAAAAIADPRMPQDKEVLDPPPVTVRPGRRSRHGIIALDGTWHRPLTTLELAALQGLPLTFPDGGVLDFGLGQGKSRELIGNAVPPASAQAVGSQILRALLAAELGMTFELSAAPVWVQPDDDERKDKEEVRS